jgi:predicted SprT family Zn-dependent metalloprotease
MIRQEYLETAIKWISDGDIKEYMGKHQHDPNASALWKYFESVINWVEATFTKYRKEMKGVSFGDLYAEFKDVEFDIDKLEKEISELMEDEDVKNKKGIYSYVLNRKEKYLNIRAFTKKQRREAYEKQKGICVKCQEYFDIDDMEADHITPWHEGGKTIAKNCQMLCKDCNRRKSGK